MAKTRASDIEDAVVKTIQHRIEEINHELRKLLESVEYFQKKHGLETEEFYEKFLKGELGDDMDFFEWKAGKEVREQLIKERDLLREAIK